MTHIWLFDSYSLTGSSDQTADVQTEEYTHKPWGVWKKPRKLVHKQSHSSSWKRLIFLLWSSDKVTLVHVWSTEETVKLCVVSLAEASGIKLRSSLRCSVLGTETSRMSALFVYSLICCIMQTAGIHSVNLFMKQITVNVMWRSRDQSSPLQKEQDAGSHMNNWCGRKEDPSPLQLVTGLPAFLFWSLQKNTSAGVCSQSSRWCMLLFQVWRWSPSACVSVWSYMVETCVSSACEYMSYWLISPLLPSPQLWTASTSPKKKKYLKGKRPSI